MKCVSGRPTGMIFEQVLSSPSCDKGPLNKKHTYHSDSNIPGNMSMNRTMSILLNSTQVECYGHHHVEGLGEIHSKEFLSGMIGLLKVTSKCALQKNTQNGKPSHPNPSPSNHLHSQSLKQKWNRLKVKGSYVSSFAFCGV